MTPCEEPRDDRGRAGARNVKVLCRPRRTVRAWRARPGSRTCTASPGRCRTSPGGARAPRRTRSTRSGGSRSCSSATPGRTRSTPMTRERYDDVIVFWVASEDDKQAMVLDPDSPYFTTPHFDGHPSVLLRGSRIGEIDLDELTELVQDAWLSRASRRRGRRGWPSAAISAETLAEPSACPHVRRDNQRRTHAVAPSAAGAGGGVEADGGGGRQVEALGAAEDRDRDPVVGQGSELLGQAPGLVAEQPGDRGRRAVRTPRRRTGRSPPHRRRRARRTRRPAPGVRPRPGRRPGRAAGATGCRPSRARSCRCRGRRCCRRARRRSAPAASAQRITVPALPGSRTSAQMTRVRGSERSRARSSTTDPSRGTSRKRQTATIPCGVTAPLREATASSSARHPGHPGVVDGLAERGVLLAAPPRSRTPRRPRRRGSASVSALAPSARNSRCSARELRRASFRAALTRPLFADRGAAGGVVMGEGGVGRFPR